MGAPLLGAVEKPAVVQCNSSHVWSEAEMGFLRVCPESPKGALRPSHKIIGPANGFDRHEAMFCLAVANILSFGPVFQY